MRMKATERERDMPGGYTGEGKKAYSKPIGPFDLISALSYARRYFKGPVAPTLEGTARRVGDRTPYEEARDEYGSRNRDINLPAMKSLRKVTK